MILLFTRLFSYLNQLDKHKGKLSGSRWEEWWKEEGRRDGEGEGRGGEKKKKSRDAHRL